MITQYARFMKKLFINTFKLRSVQEISLTIILYVILWALWSFIIKEYVVISDEGLLTITSALSVALSALTAIVVSFIIIIWQFSRQERSGSFWRWRNALIKLTDCFDANFELLSEIQMDVVKVTFEASKVSLISPMARDKFKEISSGLWGKVEKIIKHLPKIENPSSREVEKGRAYKDIVNSIVDLTNANFEHYVSHNLYRRILSLRGLVYRLLVVLIASILVLVLAATSISIHVLDVLNAPLAITLVSWVIYVFITLGLEIKRVSLLEDEFRRQTIEFD